MRRQLTKMAAAGGAFLAMTGAVIGAAMAGPTLDTVRKNDVVRCGVSGGVTGFSNFDKNGVWRGIDVDYCRALAAAVLGDPNKVKFVPLTSKQRFTVLQSGEIDILSRNTTWTLSRDTALGLNFVGVNYYDGQGFMVRKDLNLTSAKQLAGAQVCTNAGTTTELNMADYFRANGMAYTPVTFERTDETVAAYDAGRCDVYSTDQSGLYSQRIKLKDPSAHMILPEVISKEPLGPVVRQGDDEWFNIAKWTLFAMINAEEMGITQANVRQRAASEKDPAARRFLGLEGEMGEKLGLSADWAVRIIAAVGNYGESFDRNLGPNTPMNINRGLNRLWSDGGLIYAPPLR